MFVCLDDKHRCKIGEPSFPVAAAERGRRVLVSRNANFEVGDHDFTRFSVIPSVALLIDIPESIEDSWYTGQVLVGLKDAAFEHSSPERHACELQNLLQSRNLGSNPILFLYSDGGPDHKLTYTSVQASLIARSLIWICCVCPVQLHVTLGAILLRGSCLYSTWVSSWLV